MAEIICPAGIFCKSVEILEVKAVNEVEEFSCKTKLYSGPGSVSRLAELGSQRLFLVSDPYFAENGTAAQLAAVSKAGATQIYSQVKPDPTVQQVAAGTAVLKAFAPDTVVALGGGSAMDSAKAMVYFSGLSVRFVAIPTTSGSGSEVTDFAILTHEGVKHPLIDPVLCPDIAILDSELLSKLPPSLIADTGFDVLTHALEAYSATGASLVTDALAEKAFCTGYRLLPASFSGDTQVRQQLHLASTMAGMAFTRAGLGLCHAMAHAMGGLYHIPHGRLNGVLLPPVMGVNAQVHPEKYAQMAVLAGVGSASQTLSARNLKQGLIRLRKQLQLPATLHQCGISARQLAKDRETVVAATLADPCCKTNPVPVTKHMILQVLEEASGG